MSIKTNCLQLVNIILTPPVPSDMFVPKEMTDLFFHLSEMIRRMRARRFAFASNTTSN
jgi:hypothetical protein